MWTPTHPETARMETAEAGVMRLQTKGTWSPGSWERQEGSSPGAHSLTSGSWPPAQAEAALSHPVCSTAAAATRSSSGEKAAPALTPACPGVRRHEAVCGFPQHPRRRLDRGGSRLPTAGRGHRSRTWTLPCAGTGQVGLGKPGNPRPASTACGFSSTLGGGPSV